MNTKFEGKYLVTTDKWFFAPDGQQYSAVWGTAQVLEDSLLGVKTHRNSLANWFLKIGSKEKHAIIAGCQIHYAVKCEEKPYTEDTDREDVHEGTLVVSKVKSRIYIAE